MNNDLVVDVLYDLGKSYCQKIFLDKTLLRYCEALRIWKILASNKRAFEASLAIVSVELLLMNWQKQKFVYIFCL